MLYNLVWGPVSKPFSWQRLRILGGRSLVWGRQSYRLSDNDFKAASRDGYGDDWPFTYGDLAPYYDIVEKCASGRLPDMKVAPDANAPQRPNGIYVPRFRNTPRSKKDSRFIRGYGYQGGADIDFNFRAEGYGASYKEAVTEGIYGISLGAFGESLARWDNFIEIDGNLKDAWGIPALRISMTHGDNEVALMDDAGACAAEMLEAAGAKDIRVRSNVELPGMAVHESGTVRMGNDPKKSVLNPFNQAHDVKNLFVMDGASFVSSAWQNPTLTMMAITVRACANLIDRFRRNEV